MPAEDSTIPFGFCHCGCGQRTKIAIGNDREKRWIGGQPKRFIAFHDQLINGKSKSDWLIEALRTHQNSDECLVWPFGRAGKGYGAVRFQGQSLLAHRVAFYVTYRHWPMPDGCHSCDNPPCINPRHIFEGGHQANGTDMARKFRFNKKITPAIVTEIRRTYVPFSRAYGGVPLGRKYHLSNGTIRKILTRKTWKFVP